MRTLLLAAAVAALATPSLAEDATSLLQPGFYCPVGANVMPISVGEDGSMGIDSLDCERVRLESGKMLSPSCVTNGGNRVVYETDLMVMPSGSLVHDGVTFRRLGGRPPCPAG